MNQGDFMLNNHFKNYTTWLPNKQPILAVSGGLDSMVLWHLFKHHNIPHVVTTLHHHQRPEADAEYAYIESQCKELNIPFYGYHLSFDSKQNFQATARHKRREIYTELCQKLDGCIVLAHHGDDQIETLMMRVLGRGHWSTYAGMKAYDVHDDLHLLRPLLMFSKNTLESYARSHHVTYFEDASNQNLHYTRNRIRHQILPKLYNHTELTRSQLEYYRNLIERFNQLLQSSMNVSQGTLKVTDVLNYPVRVQSWFLRSWLQHHCPDYAWSSGAITSLIHTLKHSTKSWEKPIHESLSLTHAYGILSFSRKPHTSSLPITIHGVGWHPIAAQRSWFVSEEKNEQIQGKTLELWYNKSIFPIILRHRKEGDVVRMKYGHKKIKDVLIDHKMPRHQRHQVIILQHKDTVVGVWDLSLATWEDSPQHKLYITEVLHDQS